MLIEFLIIVATGCAIYDTYHNHKYTKMFWGLKRYYKLVGYGLLGLAVYTSIKSNPTNLSKMLVNINNALRIIPVDKFGLNKLNPVIDATQNFETMNSTFRAPVVYPLAGQMASGEPANEKKKRAVSETKKKYVASNQNWKCKHCQSQLDHTFEIDHRTRLEYGGSNDVSNLVALCRNCHGKKTASENM